MQKEKNKTRIEIVEWSRGRKTSGDVGLELQPNLETASSRKVIPPRVQMTSWPQATRALKARRAKDVYYCRLLGLDTRRPCADSSLLIGCYVVIPFPVSLLFLLSRRFSTSIDRRNGNDRLTEWSPSDFTSSHSTPSLPAIRKSRSISLPISRSPLPR